MEEDTDPFARDEQDLALMIRAEGPASGATSSSRAPTYARLQDPERYALLQKVSGAASVEPKGKILDLQALQRIEEVLRARETELNRKERELSEREARLGLEPEPNWPCKCYAVTFHSIAADIPVKCQRLVTTFYRLCWLTWFCLLWNAGLLNACWFRDGTGIDASEAMWSTVYLLLGVPGAWKLWYRALYFAISKKSARRWATFFISFSVHLLFFAIICSGLPGSAGTGVIFMIDQLARSNDAIAICAFVGLVLYAINFLIGLYSMKAVHTAWRASGGSVETKKELARFAMDQATQLQIEAETEADGQQV